MVETISKTILISKSISENNKSADADASLAPKTADLAIRPRIFAP